MAATDLDAKLNNDTFPADASAVFVLVTLFLMRELEVAVARMKDISFNKAEREVRLFLSVSKNDPQAKGCSRPWRCTCSTPRPPRAYSRCPYHAAKHHIQELRRLFGDLVDDDDSPLFPDRLGREIKADAVLEFIEAVAELMGEPLYSARGIRRFGKHSFRATGAVFLALMGISVEKIQLLGR